MIGAVQAHEQVREQRLLPALEQSVPSIMQEIAAISIPDNGTLVAAAAATAPEADARFQSALHEAYVSWIANVFGSVLNDHYGRPADQAEENIVDPMIAAIRAEAEARRWPGLDDAPNIHRTPASRSRSRSPAEGVGRESSHGSYRGSAARRTRPARASWMISPAAVTVDAHRPLSPCGRAVEQSTFAACRS